MITPNPFLHQSHLVPQTLATMGTLLAAEVPAGMGLGPQPGNKLELSFSLDDPAFMGDHFR